MQKGVAVSLPTVVGPCTLRQGGMHACCGIAGLCRYEAPVQMLRTADRTLHAAQWRAVLCQKELQIIPAPRPGRLEQGKSRALMLTDCPASPWAAGQASHHTQSQTHGINQRCSPGFEGPPQLRPAEPAGPGCGGSQPSACRAWCAAIAPCPGGWCCAASPAHSSQA